jgi:hypothetical protein
LDNFGWENYKAKCSDFSFELGLIVDTHLALLALPDLDAVAAGCNPLVFHSSPHEEGIIWRKEVLALDHSSNAFVSMKENLMMLHSHTFSEIAVAYEQADAGGNTGDIVMNNCGDFVKSFASIVGEKATPAMTATIAQRLIEKSSGQIADDIRRSEHARTLGVTGDGLTNDKNLVERLVESRTRELYEV